MQVLKMRAKVLQYENELAQWSLNANRQDRKEIEQLQRELGKMHEKLDDERACLNESRLVEIKLLETKYKNEGEYQLAVWFLRILNASF